MLVTRCPACSTSFKVVRDQLRLADGWVRCGRCDKVFQATDALAQWEAHERDSVAPPPAPFSPPGPHAAPAAALADARATPDFMTAQALSDTSPTAEPAPGHEPAPPAPRAASVAPAPDPEAAELAQDIPAPAAAPGATQDSPDPAPDSAVEPTPAAHRYIWESAPARASHLARPHPLATAGWALVGLAGLSGLMIQAALAWHDELAQAAPALRPALEVACVMADCKIEPLRRIEALTVESSQLTQLGGTVYQFTTTIRNRALVELTPPALDLVLTGGDGQVIARKTLRWADFGLRARAMAAQQDLTLQTHLNTGSNAVAGFTIELFYP